MLREGIELTLRIHSLCLIGMPLKQSYVPVLVSLLEAFTHAKTLCINITVLMEMCAGLVLKHRFSEMSLVQKIISLVLYAGHSDNQVHIYS